MKLTTKLTAICAALVLTVAAALSGLMLWQVREQSYNSLEEHTQEKLNNLVMLLWIYSPLITPQLSHPILKKCICSITSRILM